MSYQVYCLETNDGKKYIGTTSTSLETRWNNGNGYRFIPALWEIICAIGWDNVTKTVLGRSLNRDEASKLEQYYISLYNTCDPKKGYNSELGGVGADKLISERSRAKMAESKRGQLNPNFGKHFSEEHRNKLAKSNRGQKRSLETCRKICIARSKPVCQYTIGGELLATWDSAKQAALSTGAQAGHITKVCMRQRKTAGGFVWAYA